MVASRLPRCPPLPSPPPPVHPELRFVLGVCPSPSGLRVSTVALIVELSPFLGIDSGMGCGSILASEQ